MISATYKSVARPRLAGLAERSSSPSVRGRRQAGVHMPGPARTRSTIGTASSRGHASSSCCPGRYWSRRGMGAAGSVPAALSPPVRISRSRPCPHGRGRPVPHDGQASAPDARAAEVVVVELPVEGRHGGVGGLVVGCESPWYITPPSGPWSARPTAAAARCQQRQRLRSGHLVAPDRHPAAGEGTARSGVLPAGQSVGPPGWTGGPGPATIGRCDHSAGRGPALYHLDAEHAGPAEEPRRSYGPLPYGCDLRVYLLVPEFTVYPPLVTARTMLNENM